MNAVQLMTGKGGWPLNCIALPNGKPIFGGTYFTKNQWAFIKYCRLKKMNLFALRKQKLKAHHIELLFFLVDVCTIKNLITKDFNSVTYTYVGTNFILNNLPILFLRDFKNETTKEYNRLNRTIQNYIKTLKNLGLIDVKIDKQNKRYIQVDNDLLRYCNKGKFKITPYEFMNKYFKENLKALKNKYEPILRKGLYEKNINTFFNEQHRNQIIQKNYFIDNDLLYRLETYLKECVKDPFFVEHRSRLNE
jgi:hypothetical protein